LIGLIKTFRAWNGRHITVEEVFDQPYETDMNARGKKRTKINRALVAVLQKAEEYIDNGVDVEFWQKVMDELHYAKIEKKS
jgi:hypothetical protein